MNSGGETMAHILAADRLDDIVRGRSEEFGDDGELIDVILAREQRLALEHLGKDTPGTPDVNLHVVLLPCEHDLGRSVVSRRDVARHLGILNPRQSKVTDLQVAVLVDQDVTRLEVAMDHSGRVHVFETTLGISAPAEDVRDSEELSPESGIGSIG